MGDLNQRRGRILTTGSEGAYALIKANVPLAELQTYSNELRSITGGEGSYTMVPSHYDPVPARQQQDLVSAYKPQEDAD